MGGVACGRLVIRRDRRVAVAIKALLDDVHRSLEVTQLARRVNLSPSRLRHLFKQELGMSILEFRKKQRFERARLLLVTTFQSVKEVAAEIEAGDESHFVRDFKRAFGESPTSYRLALGETLRAMPRVATSANK